MQGYAVSTQHVGAKHDGRLAAPAEPHGAWRSGPQQPRSCKPWAGPLPDCCQPHDAAILGELALRCLSLAPTCTVCVCWQTCCLLLDIQHCLSRGKHALQRQGPGPGRPMFQTPTASGQFPDIQDPEKPSKSFTGSTRGSP